MKLVIQKHHNGKGCMDCKCFHYEAAYYMVHDHIWNIAVPEKSGLLCLSCLSKRLGRILTPKDFTICGANMRIFDVLSNVMVN